MNRREFVRSLAVSGAPALAGGALAHPSEPTGNRGNGADASESARRIRRATDAAMAMQRRDWEQGILAQAMLEAAERDRLIQLTKAAMVLQMPDGRMGVVGSGSPTDPAMGGPAYSKAAEWTGDRAMQKAVEDMLEWILHKAPRNAHGILYHTFHAQEMWSDGLNGAPPFLAAMGFYDEALKQIDGYRERLWNAEKKLFAHTWDDARQHLKDPAFWGGGNGWAAAGLTRVVRSLPAERRHDRERLSEFIHEIVDGCLAYQRRDGLFHNVVDRPETFVETNLAQMMAYAVYTCIAEGWLPMTYRAKADGMRAAARTKMDSFGFVQGACSAPDFDRPGTSTEAQAFCILMETAGSRFE